MVPDNMQPLSLQVAASPNPDWFEVVERVRVGDPTGVEALYHAFNRLRWYFRRRLGPDPVDDCYHGLMVMLVTQIRDGKLRDPARLAGYVRTIARIQVVQQLQRKATQRCESSPDDHEVAERGESFETQLARKEMVGIARRILCSLPARDRGVLIRFYLDEQSPEDIRKEFGLTENQFRLIKSRAKGRFDKLCRSALRRKAALPMSSAAC